MVRGADGPAELIQPLRVIALCREGEYIARCGVKQRVQDALAQLLRGVPQSLRGQPSRRGDRQGRQRGCSRKRQHPPGRDAGVLLKARQGDAGRGARREAGQQIRPLRDPQHQRGQHQQHRRQIGAEALRGDQPGQQPDAQCQYHRGFPREKGQRAGHAGDLQRGRAGKLIHPRGAARQEEPCRQHGGGTRGQQQEAPAPPGAQRDQRQFPRHQSGCPAGLRPQARHAQQRQQQAAPERHGDQHAAKQAHPQALIHPPAPSRSSRRGARNRPPPPPAAAARSSATGAGRRG